MNYSTLDVYSSRYSNASNLEAQWDGQRSCKFPKTKRIIRGNELIKTNFQMPDQTVHRGMAHFYQPSSYERQQKPYRSMVHKVPPIKHWCLRESKIRTMQFKPTQHLPRPQRRHNIEYRRNPQTQRHQSIRTSIYGNPNAYQQYSVQDRMQRKTRIDLYKIRKDYYKNASYGYNFNQ